jgi:23S rRNA pseudouridine955/2504/2580 synthase
MIELTASKDDNGRRLDRILRKALPELSLSLIHRLLRQKKILVDNKPATPNHRIEQGMVIKVNAPATHISEQVNKTIVNHKYKQVNGKTLRLQPPTTDPRSPVPILWQGSGIIVFNKPQGLSTHGPQSLDSIVSAWLAAGGAGPLPRSLSFKPGPLHRLDKPTSGVIAFSQTLEGAKLFSTLLRERKLEKTYIAIVEGNIEQEESWQDTLTHDKNAHKTFVKTKPQGGKATYPNPRPRTPDPKEALTTIKPLASNGKYSLIEARINTGRHHQIRAQAASHGHPLAGDIKYSGKQLPGQSRGGGFFLHAWKIRFTECPNGFPQEIIAPLPEEFQAKIEALFGK